MKQRAIVPLLSGYDMKTYCVVLPVFNNAATVEHVIRRILCQTSDLLVIDDGSTDLDLPALCKRWNVECVRHEINRGKGAALRTALQILQKRPYDYMITLDADGQHFPEDIPAFLPLMEQDGALIIGSRNFNDPNVPQASRVGRSFSNFVIKWETGISLEDTQSGFRAYPLKHIAHLPFKADHYNFETEILLRAAWANLPLINLPVRTFYPPRNERVSHFRPWYDTVRICMTHIRLLFSLLLAWCSCSGD